MRDPKLIMKIANDAADSYLTKKIDMNTSITKEAEANNLSKEEIQRVVEFANTKAYLELRKTAEQNYVDFDVADANKIEIPGQVVEEKIPVITSTHSDYKKPPIKEASLEKAAHVEEKTFEKRAYEFSKEETPVYEKTISELENKVAVDKVDVDERVNKLSKSVRQLLLQGADSSDIKSMFLMIDKSGKVWEQIVANIGEEFPMSKTAEFKEGKTLNPESSLVKEAYVTSTIIGRLVTNTIAYDMIKTAFLEEKESIKQASIAKMHPAVKGGAIAVIGGSVYGLGAKHEQAQQTQDKLDYYNKLKPGRGGLV